MDKTCLNFDRNAKVIIVHEYASGRGDKWTGKPMYVIPCQCGYPLKAMFAGAMPKMITKCEFNSYNHKEKIKVYELKKHEAWSLELQEKHCPACGAAIAIGPDLLIAVEKFIRAHVTATHVHYNSNKIKVSPNARRALEAMPKFKSIIIMQEAITRRADYAVTWRTGNEKHEFGQGDWNTWYNRRQAEIMALETAFGLSDENTEPEPDPFDFSDEVMAAHAEDCTCNLCQK